MKWYVLLTEMRKPDRRIGVSDGENQVEMLRKQLQLRREVRAEDTHLGVFIVQMVFKARVSEGVTQAGALGHSDTWMLVRRGGDQKGG